MCDVDTHMHSYIYKTTWENIIDESGTLKYVTVVQKSNKRQKVGQTEDKTE